MCAAHVARSCGSSALFRCSPPAVNSKGVSRRSLFAAGGCAVPSVRPPPPPRTFYPDARRRSVPCPVANFHRMSIWIGRKKFRWSIVGVVCVFRFFCGKCRRIDHAQKFGNVSISVPLCVCFFFSTPKVQNGRRCQHSFDSELIVGEANSRRWVAPNYFNAYLIVPRDLINPTLYLTFEWTWSPTYFWLLIYHLPHSRMLANWTSFSFTSSVMAREHPTLPISTRLNWSPGFYLNQEMLSTALWTSASVEYSSYLHDSCIYPSNFGEKCRNQRPNWVKWPGCGRGSVKASEGSPVSPLYLEIVSQNPNEWFIVFQLLPKKTGPWVGLDHRPDSITARRRAAWPGRGKWVSLMNIWTNWIQTAPTPSGKTEKAITTETWTSQDGRGCDSVMVTSWRPAGTPNLKEWRWGNPLIVVKDLFNMGNIFLGIWWSRFGTGQWWSRSLQSDTGQQWGSDRGWCWASGPSEAQKVAAQATSQVGNLLSARSSQRRPNRKQQRGGRDARFIGQQPETFGIRPPVQTILSFRRDKSVRQNRKLHPSGAAWRGLICHCLQRIQQVSLHISTGRKYSHTNGLGVRFGFQFDSAGRGLERDSTARRRRRSVHGHPRGVAASGFAPRQRRHAARHRPHQNVAHFRFWIRRKLTPPSK